MDSTGGYRRNTTSHTGVSTTDPLFRKVRRAGADLLPSWILARKGVGRRKQLALTFDDGPDEMTPQYVRLLERLGVRATFFLVGENCANHRGDVLDLVRAGHELAGHGYTHRRFTKLSAAELRDELDSTQALLPPPRTPRPLVRPPHGSTSLQSLLRCSRAGYTTVLWSADSMDARTALGDEVALQLTPDKVAPGDIALLHEGQLWTLDALPRIVRGLQGAGFELVTVGEVLAP